MVVRFGIGFFFFSKRRMTWQTTVTNNDNNNKCLRMTSGLQLKKLRHGEIFGFFKKIKEIKTKLTLASWQCSVFSVSTSSGCSDLVG
jgi:hypothetical protein